MKINVNVEIAPINVHVDVNTNVDVIVNVFENLNVRVNVSVHIDVKFCPTPSTRASHQEIVASLGKDDPWNQLCGKKKLRIT